MDALEMMGFWIDRKGLHDALTRYYEGPDGFERDTGTVLPADVREAYVEAAARVERLLAWG